MSLRLVACSMLVIASLCLGAGTAGAQDKQTSTESDKERIERLEAIVADLNRRLKVYEERDAAAGQHIPVAAVTQEAAQPLPVAAVSEEAGPPPAAGAAGSNGNHQIELYGYAQIDAIQDFKRVDPDWDATLRPSKIPTTNGQFGSDGQTLFSVRQSRLGVKADGELAGKPYEARIEFDMFGTGVDAGQTTFRLRHAYGKWGPILAGQTRTLFMDGDLSPRVIDHFGPAGLVSVRTPQLRFTFADNDRWMAAVALENPRDDIDPGAIRLIDPDLATNLRPNEELPDLTAQVQYRGSWGHVTLAGIARKIGFDTVGSPGNEPSGSEFGWGLNGGAVVKVSPATFRVATVYGRGIATYMNDGGMDLAPSAALVPGPTPPNLLIEAEAVKLLGLSAYVELHWLKTLSSSLGYSFTKVDNTNFQEGTAFHKGEYASGNLLWTPADRLLTGVELLWGKRTDNGGDSGTDLRAQFSFRVSFSSDEIWSN